MAPPDRSPVSHAPEPTSVPGEFSPSGVCGPHPKLLTHYTILSVLTGPGFLIAFPLALCRYLTLRYRFDADGVNMTVGVLFKREVALTYRRIQDIHVNRGIIQRWLGLATVACQTASGSSTPELVIEGLLDYERVRDFLYQQMRGARGQGTGPAVQESRHGVEPAAHQDEALVLLREIRDLLAERGRG